jgi:hypothetical protein
MENKPYTGPIAAITLSNNGIKSQNNGLKNFWRKDGHDYIADIGTMKKAVIIRYYLGGAIRNNYYSISEASYFPFSKEQYDQRFDTPEPAMALAESVLKEWVQSLLM